MLYGNSFTNPIIYNACNEEFRKSFRSYFRMLIKPCAVLLLGDRLSWDDRPDILDDLGTTLNRTRSFRRLSSRRETLINVNNEATAKVPNGQEDGNNNRTNRKISFANGNTVENHRTCSEHANRTNHRYGVPHGKDSLVEYVSVL
jgi:hypothetical protein